MTVLCVALFSVTLVFSSLSLKTFITAPVLSHAWPVNGAVAGGTAITLSGLGLPPAVVLGATACATTAWLSPSSVVCRASAGASKVVAPVKLLNSMTMDFNYDRASPLLLSSV